MRFVNKGQGHHVREEFFKVLNSIIDTSPIPISKNIQISGREDMYSLPRSSESGWSCFSVTVGKEHAPGQ